MNNLIDRGLIEAKGRLDAPGRPMLYGTTTDFLRAFGLKSISELPSTTEEIEEMFAKANNAANDNEVIQESIDIEEAKESDEASRAAMHDDSAAQEHAEVSSGITDSYEEEQSAEDDVLNEDN
jgi:hypothetical protein